MDENPSILELQVDPAAAKNLSDAARWAKFLSIVGFVCLGIVVILFLALQTQIANALAQYIPGLSTTDSFSVLLIIILIAAALIGLLMYFLFRGSTLIKRGIETKSQETFNNGLASLKAYFTMYGVLAILGLISELLNLNR